MARYLEKTCPKCRDYLGLVIHESGTSKELPVIGKCMRCKYEFHWSLVRGRKHFDRINGTIPRIGKRDSSLGSAFLASRFALLSLEF